MVNKTSGVSFTETEKLNIAKLLLEDLKVDRIEIASARVSEGEFKGAKVYLSGRENTATLIRLKFLDLLMVRNL
jgi:D-citramalate synthase